MKIILRMSVVDMCNGVMEDLPFEIVGERNICNKMKYEIKF